MGFHSLYNCKFSFETFFFLLNINIHRGSFVLEVFLHRCVFRENKICDDGVNPGKIYLKATFKHTRHNGDVTSKQRRGGGFFGELLGVKDVDCALIRSVFLMTYVSFSLIISSLGR